MTDRHFRPMRLRRVALVLAALAAACSPSTGQVERALEDELHRVVGPADHYDVEIDGLRAGDGEADRMRATGEGVRPRGAPAIDRIEVEMRDVRYDRDRKRIERLGSAHAVATITAADLARYLERQSAIEDADVTLEAPDRALLRLRPDLGIPLPGGAVADVTGRVVGDGSYLRFEVEGVRAAGLGLGGRAIETLTRLINPLVDLSEMPVAFEVTDVRVENGLLRVEAEAGPGSLRP